MRGKWAVHLLNKSSFWVLVLSLSVKLVSTLRVSAFKKPMPLQYIFQAKTTSLTMHTEHRFDSFHSLTMSPFSPQMLPE